MNAPHIHSRRTSAEPRIARAGAAAVELAVALPVLAMLVLGCVDLGRVAKTAIALNHAVAVGAVEGTVHRRTSQNQAAWETRIETAVDEELSTLRDFDDSQLQLEISVTMSSASETLVTVTGRYPFTPLIAWPGLPTTLTLKHSVTGVQYR